jgi:hypothetical protein
MKAALRFIAVVSGAALLGFAAYDMVSFGWRISTSASCAPEQFWHALVDAVAWGIQYKEWATLILIVCLVVLYCLRNTAIKSR